MQFSSLFSRPFSVSQVIDNPETVGQYVAVHGVLFFGSIGEELCDDFFCLPKDDHFNGHGFDFSVSVPIHGSFLYVRETGLDERLRSARVPRMAGSAAYNMDAIIVGRIAKGLEGQLSITNLVCAILHRAPDPEMSSRLRFHLIGFGNVPHLPLQGPSLDDPMFGPDLEIS